ncbi:hypothetical protein J3F84DRAFT_354659, partial [Trichoderma pleuroticola]
MEFSSTQGRPPPEVDYDPGGNPGMSDLLRGEAGFGRCKPAAVRTPYLGRYQVISLRSNYRPRMRFRGGLKKPPAGGPLCVSFAVYDFASLCFPPD